MLKLIPFLFLMACAASIPWSPPVVTHCGQITGNAIIGEQRDCFELSAIAVTPADYSRERPSLGHYLADRLARRVDE